MSALLRRIGAFLVLSSKASLRLANRVQQRPRLTLAPKPLSPSVSAEQELDEIRYRNARYY